MLCMWNTGGSNHRILSDTALGYTDHLYLLFSAKKKAAVGSGARTGPRRGGRLHQSDQVHGTPADDVPRPYETQLHMQLGGEHCLPSSDT